MQLQKGLFILLSHILENPRFVWGAEAAQSEAKWQLCHVPSILVQGSSEPATSRALALPTCYVPCQILSLIRHF